ncbi:hypothetical protein TIFTF001_041083 [Ficus carica]|uniref:Uncharacterized protein n=1 Tax=Ficus carica TaxID=3494 RepID=A0AA87Z0Z4_FICCA|nr:hypothetical protein TIFTF001_041083 [Ficus carica]
MFTNDNIHDKSKIKFKVGSWFELDWAGRPNHSMAVRNVVLAERKLTTYVYAVGSALEESKDNNMAETFAVELVNRKF